MTLVLIVVLVVVLLSAVGLVAARARRAPRPVPPVSEARPEPQELPIRPTGLGERIRALFDRGADSEETWRALEEALVRADVGPAASARIVEGVRESYTRGADPAALVAGEVARTFDEEPGWRLRSGSPAVIMVVGVNGTGKTTTIGKLAAMLRRQGLSVTLAASDTFRAAAGEQLDTWAGRAGADLVAQNRGADPGAVAFDAVQAARARRSDVLIVDTAGRLHTRAPLMDELAKVKRVLEKAGGPVHEVLLVIDATTGQNGIAQARAFTQAIGITGIILSKMDGTARGGIVVAVREELGVPVRFVGTGEGLEDLAPFDPEAFARRLVA